MINKLVLDYIDDQGLRVYVDGGRVEMARIVGDRVCFDEVSKCGYYRDVREVCLADIFAWVYLRTPKTEQKP